MEVSTIKSILEAAMLAAGRTLSVDDMHKLFKWGHRPDKKLLREALSVLVEDYADRAIEVKEVASGFRIQVRPEFAEYMDGLNEERSPRYSRALLETLALIAYRQPITRGEIEEIRGVAVSSNIVRTLQEREWIRGLGHRDVPGKPEMFGTTRQFLDYFNLKKLDDLPALSELTDIEGLKIQLDLPEVEGMLATTGNIAALDAAPEDDTTPGADDESAVPDSDESANDEPGTPEASSDAPDEPSVDDSAEQEETAEVSAKAPDDVDAPVTDSDEAAEPAVADGSAEQAAAAK